MSFGKTNSNWIWKHFHVTWMTRSIPFDWVLKLTKIPLSICKKRQSICFMINKISQRVSFCRLQELETGRILLQNRGIHGSTSPQIETIGPHLHSIQIWHLSSFRLIWTRQCGKRLLLWWFHFTTSNIRRSRGKASINLWNWTRSYGGPLEIFLLWSRWWRCKLTGNPSSKWTPFSRLKREGPFVHNLPSFLESELGKKGISKQVKL